MIIHRYELVSGTSDWLCNENEQWVPVSPVQGPPKPVCKPGKWCVCGKQKLFPDVGFVVKLNALTHKHVLSSFRLARQPIQT